MEDASQAKQIGDNRSVQAIDGGDAILMSESSFIWRYGP
jgi:hypothetical protein